MRRHIFLAVLVAGGVATASLGAEPPVRPAGRPATVSDQGPMPGTAAWDRDLLRDPPCRGVDPAEWDGDPLMGDPLGGLRLGWRFGWHR